MWAYCLVKTVKEVVVQVLLLGSSVSEEVLKHRAMVEKYAKSDITEYVPILLIQVESGGTMEDVMQSSESAGLPPNSLVPRHPSNKDVSILRLWLSVPKN